MRIAFVSPYSWTYPGGVTRHIEALATQFIAGGHDVRVLTPFDPNDPLSARLHRGVAPQQRELPDYVTALGRTVGIPANGAVSNLSLSIAAAREMRRELRGGHFDVAHIHEPVAPLLAWDALGTPDLPLVATFHAYSTNRLTNGAANAFGATRRLSHLHARIAVSEAAAWTGMRFYGGAYRVIPNGVDVASPIVAAPAVPVSEQRPLRLVFIGQTVQRKGLPVLLRAFEALREHIPVTLTVVGADQVELDELLLDTAGVTGLGKVSDERKHAELALADLLIAPSLGSESFGMVLTEAFAAGTAVVASDIAGYRDVVRDGVDGVLVEAGNAVALGEGILSLALDPQRRTRLAQAAAERAPRFAWSRVATDVMSCYEEAIAMARPATATGRLGARFGLLAPDGQRRTPAQRHLPSLELVERTRKERLIAKGRRLALLGGVVLGSGLIFLALQRVGLTTIAQDLLTSRPDWVLVGLALMCASMILRGNAWHAILVAALPDAHVRRRDAMQGTFIGVLMSATLPARLGEPSRWLIVARRVGRPRETLPLVLGTMVSQTLLNLAALAVLGVVMFSSIDIFNGRHSALLLAAIVPVGLAMLVLAAPFAFRGGGALRSRRLAQVRNALTLVRSGLRVFRQPRLATVAVGSQFGAWALQCLSCYTLFVALGLGGRADLAAAAGVLFAVNVTAVLPVTPSNVGVFQAACVAVLAGAYHVSYDNAIAYGIVLQVVEIATAVLMGMPALVREGVSWRDVRMRTMYSSPVSLRLEDGTPSGSRTALVGSGR